MPSWKSVKVRDHNRSMPLLFFQSGDSFRQKIWIFSFWQFFIWNNLGNAGNWTLGYWVRNKYATYMLCSPKSYATFALVESHGVYFFKVVQCGDVNANVVAVASWESIATVRKTNCFSKCNWSQNFIFLLFLCCCRLCCISCYCCLTIVVSIS